MKKSFNLYPKNKIKGGTTFFQLPLRHINSFSAEKNRKFEYNPVFPKSKKIRKLIEEINLSNKSNIIYNNNNNYDEHNNLFICQKLLLEERIKNQNYTDNIIRLNNHIDELEFQLSQKCEHHLMNEELIRLKKENEELKLFKQKVYEFSKKYDEINNDILSCLQNIEKIIDSNTLNNPNSNFDESKNNSLDKISENFNSIVKNLTNYLNTKQDEYNTLLLAKENEIIKLKKEYNYKNNINKIYDEAKYSNSEMELEKSKDNNDYNSNYYPTNGNYELYSANEINSRKENEPNEYKNSFQNI